MEAGCPPATAAACVAAPSVRTLPDQLTGAGLTWKAYAEDKPADCSTPAPRLPFMWFHALVDDPSCASAIAGVDQLVTDLTSPDRTPAFSYVVPGACHDGSEAPCAPGSPGLGCRPPSRSCVRSWRASRPRRPTRPTG